MARSLALKTSSDTDGRGIALSLTEAGLAVWQQVMQLIAKRNASIFGCLTEVEQDQLGKMLDKIAKNVR